MTAPDEGALIEDGGLDHDPLLLLASASAGRRATLRAARNEALFRLATLTGVTPSEASQAAAARFEP